MARRIEFSETALQTLAGMGKINRRFVLNGVRTHLKDNDPAAVTRNQFVLRHPSAHAQRELRLDQWRVFYTVSEDANGQLVLVNLIGQERGNRLFIDGEEFQL